ncbi:hypothetical protein [Nocardioides sp.]|uniref:hypothetical protein n=1 Tax=Nocardioides sp. TaxID=35761 RepID=UPI002ED41028
MNAELLGWAILPAALMAWSRLRLRNWVRRHAPRELITEVRDLPRELRVHASGVLDRPHDTSESVWIRSVINDCQGRRAYDSEKQLPQSCDQVVDARIDIGSVLMRAKSRIPHHQQTVDHGASELAAGLVQLSHLPRVRSVQRQ